MRGIVVCRSTNSSGRARTTIDESAKATAIETARAISRSASGDGCGSIGARDVMAGAYGSRPAALPSSGDQERDRGELAGRRDDRQHVEELVVAEHVRDGIGLPTA